MQWFKSHKALLAYLFLTFWVAYAVYAVQNQAGAFHADSTAQSVAIRNSLIQGCTRTNDLRLTLQALVTDTKGAKQFLKDGTITQAQYDRAVAQAKENAKKLAPINCPKLYPVVKETQ